MFKNYGYPSVKYPGYIYSVNLKFGVKFRYPPIFTLKFRYPRYKIEIWELNSGGVHLFCKIEIWGGIVRKIKRFLTVFG
jgi:hypothetical protein